MQYRDYFKALRRLAGGLVVWGGSVVGSAVGLNIAGEWLASPNIIDRIFGGLLLAGVAGLWYAFAKVIEASTSISTEED